VKDGLGEKLAKMLVAELTYEITDATIDSQILQMHGVGVDVLIDATSPKFAAQAIRKVYEIGWKPLHFLNNTSVSVGTVLTPAGLDKSIGLITSRYIKDPTDSRWDGDPGMIAWRAFMKAYYPDGNVIDSANVTGYAQARTLVQVLKQCGDNLSRENVMKQGASLKDYDSGVSLPGIMINTSSSDFAPIKALQLARFDGKTWVPFGQAIDK
jgi:branched-chain amino acid transport system substrate-binding protein